MPETEIAMQFTALIPARLSESDREAKLGRIRAYCHLYGHEVAGVEEPGVRVDGAVVVDCLGDLGSFAYGYILNAYRAETDFVSVADGAGTIGATPRAIFHILAMTAQYVLESGFGPGESPLLEENIRKMLP